MIIIYGLIMDQTEHLMFLINVFQKVEIIRLIYITLRFFLNRIFLTKENLKP